MELKVLKEFQDKNNPGKSYKVGENLSVEEISRINDLVSRGICVIVSVDSAGKSDKVAFSGKEFELKKVKEALTAIGIQIAPNAGVAAVNKKIEELTEEQINILSETLNKE